MKTAVHATWSPTDTARARADTAGCARQIAHLNNAGAALPPDVVVETVVDHIRLEQTAGGYEASAATAEDQQHVYDAVASLIGAA